MFDIIGFKALRKEKGTAGLYRQYERGIFPAILHSIAGKGKTEIVNGVQTHVPDFSDSKLRYLIISDSVIFFTPDDSFESFFSIINSSFMLLQFGFSGGRAPFRGAIGWGDLICSSTGIFIGGAIEDAYVGESMQAWAGAMLTENCRDFVNQNKYIEKYRSFHEEISVKLENLRDKENAIANAKKIKSYEVPAQKNPKSGPVVYGLLETYVLDWTIRMYEGASGKSFSDTSDVYSETIAKNTKTFEAWARKNNL